MSTDLERLVVQLSADIKKYENALNRANGITNQRARAIESRFNKMNATIAASYGGLATTAAKAFALIGGAQGFRQLSDSGTRITNSLKVAGLAGDELEGVYQKLFSAAQKNAAPLETLVQLYGRVSLVQKELGVSSDQIIELSSNVALALRASGQSSQEASGALLQLSQALGGGVVRAEEFNSILEGSPTILQAAAAGIKQAEGSVAKLRNIMLEGKLSSKALFDGLNAGAQVLEQKVAGAVLTVDQRMENLRTALTNAVREFNESTQAANTFGLAIDNVATFVNGLDMGGLAGDIQFIIDKLNTGASAAQNFGIELGKLSGLANIGQGIIGALDRDGDGKLSALGGALGVEPTVSSSQRLVDNTQKRLSLERQIAEIRSNPANALGPAEIKVLEGQIKALEEAQSNAASNIIQDVLNDKALKFPTNAPVIIGGDSKTKTVNGKKFTPIDITESKYRATGDKDGKKKKTRETEYQREIEQITKRTDALKAETAAQAGLNPLLNDYGFAVEFARAKQDLLTAAQEAGIKITPELTASIESLASGYANAVAASEKLAEKQDEIRQRAEEAMATAKDVTRGLIDGFIEGASAADLLKDSLKKIADTLLNDVLNSIFKVNNAGSGGGFLSGLFSLLGGGGFASLPTTGPVPTPRPFADGGYTGDGGKYQPAGVVHKGEYVFDKAAVAAAGGPAAMEAMRRGLKGYANGGAVGVSVPTLPSIKPQGQQPINVTYAPVIDARGADEATFARFQAENAKTKAEIPGIVLRTMKQVGPRGIKI